MKLGKSSTASSVSVLFAVTWTILRKKTIVKKSEFFKHLKNLKFTSITNKNLLPFLHRTQKTIYSL